MLQAFRKRSILGALSDSVVTNDPAAAGIREAGYNYQDAPVRSLSSIQVHLHSLTAWMLVVKLWKEDSFSSEFNILHNAWMFALLLRQHSGSDIFTTGSFISSTFRPERNMLTRKSESLSKTSFKSEALVAVHLRPVTLHPKPKNN